MWRMELQNACLFFQALLLIVSWPQKSLHTKSDIPKHPDAFRVQGIFFESLLRLPRFADYQLHLSGVGICFLYPAW